MKTDNVKESVIRMILLLLNVVIKIIRHHVHLSTEWFLATMSLVGFIPMMIWNIRDMSLLIDDLVVKSP